MTVTQWTPLMYASLDVLLRSPERSDLPALTAGLWHPCGLCP